MKPVVMIPTFDRSEFLYVCLEAIRAADPNIEIRVFPIAGPMNRLSARNSALDKN